MVPLPKFGSNKRSVDIREVVNGVMFFLGTGCQWRGRIVATRRPPKLARGNPVYHVLRFW